MHEYHYLPPSQDDQRAFMMQILGAFLGLALVAFLWWRNPAFEIHAVLIGVAIAVLWILANAAWRLERKARRSQIGRVGFDENQLFITDWRGTESVIPWSEILQCDMKLGRLRVKWKGGELLVGARELERGMEFVQRVIKASRGGKSTFIPLTPQKQPSRKNPSAGIDETSEKE